MGACLHLQGVTCDNCRSDWNELLRRAHEESERRRRETQPVPWYSPPVPTPYTSIQPVLPRPCTHCYCQDAIGGLTPHKQCCNCGNKQKVS